MTVSTLSMIVFLVLAIGVFFGFLLGMFLKYSALDYSIKSSMRQRIDADASDKTPDMAAIKSRREERYKVDRTLVDAKAPVLDLAGVIVPNEELRFTAALRDISKHGACIVSRHFVPIGTTILVMCKASFFPKGYIEAEIRNMTIAKSGLRIGLEFFKPIANFVPPK